MGRQVLLLITLTIGAIGCAQQPGSSNYSRVSSAQAMLPVYVPAQELAAAKAEPGFYPGLTAQSERETAGRRYPARVVNERHVEKSALESYRSRNADDIAKIEAARDRYRREPAPGCIGVAIHDCVAALSNVHIVSTNHVGNVIDRPKRDIVGASDGSVMFRGTINSIGDARTGQDVFAGDKIGVTVYAEANEIVRSVAFEFPDGSLTWAKTEAEFQATRIHELFSATAGKSCDIGAKDFYVALYTDLLKNGRREQDRFYNSLDSISRVQTTNYYAQKPICGLKLSYDVWEQRSASRKSYGETDRYTLWLKGAAEQTSRGSAARPAQPKAQ